MKLSIVILTGLSGSGKTVALRSLEDCGFFCTDNLPPQLINEFIKLSSSSGNKLIAIGIDIREKGFLSGIERTIGDLKGKYNIDIVFLEAEKSVIMRRFKETRRPHPLSKSFDSNIDRSLEDEISILAPLREMSDRIVDTTPYSPHQLRDIIRSIYGGPLRDKLSVVLTSFGFKFGVPQFADIVFDVRFLANPHFIPELRERTGKEIPVRDFVMNDSNYGEISKKIKDMMRFLIPLYIKEGKSSLNVCIGCTGGRHRSVVIIEELIDLFKGLPVHIEVVHREL